MLSHRPSTRSLALAALVSGAALLLSACGAGRTGQGFGATRTVTVTKQVGAPPVISAAPSGAAATAAAPGAPAGASTADKKTAEIKLELRKERRREALARKHAAARERKLRKQLAGVRVKGAHATGRKPPPPAAAPVRGSDTSGTTQADGDVQSARAQVVTFHELLNSHDPAACDLMTPRLLTVYYGPDPAQAPARCRATVQSLTLPVSATIEGAGVRDGLIRVRVVSHMGDATRRQTLVMQLVDGQWLIDAVQPAAS